MLLRIAIGLKNSDLEVGFLSHFKKNEYIILKMDKKNPLRLLGREPADLIVVSESLLPKPLSDSISTITCLPEAPTIILVTDSADDSYHAKLLAEGGDAVLYSGLAEKDFFAAIDGLALKKLNSRVNIIKGKQQPGEPRLSDFVSNSRSMVSFINIARRVVKSDTSVLILGETGVGKERLALALHTEGARSNGPFIPINCAALPDSLLESELFGHEQGAFTGAVRARRGAFEMAHEGTIFLDEVGDMPLLLQAKLLRVLQDRRFMKVGGERTIEVNVRLMAATNRDLAKAVEEGSFRRDLYYRLSVVTLLIPPLRERMEDIAELVHSYIDYLRPRIGVEVDDIDGQALEALRKYRWPGNVRELINVLERAMLLCDSNIISIRELPDELSGVLGGLEKAVGGFVLTENSFKLPWRELKKDIVAYYEREYIAEKLMQNKGRINETAKVAGMTPRALYDKMRQYGLDKKKFKD